MIRYLMSMACCVAILAISAPAAAQDVNDLLPFIPEDANSIAVIRARELKDSPRGQVENWSDQHETQFLAGAATVPPWVQLLVRATYVQPGHGGGDWTAVLIPIPRAYTMDDLATREESQVQDIASHNAVYSPRHRGYFVELSQASSAAMGVLGGIAPASRQDAARWIDESQATAGEVRISDYLVAAANETESQIVIALDTNHMFDPAVIAHRLNGCVALEGHDAEKDALAQAFAEMRGVTLAIKVENAVHMALRFDFNVDLGDEAQYVKPVFMELMNDLGAALDELETAETYIYARSVSLESPLSDESLRRILSMVTTPKPDSPEEPAVAETDPPTDPPSETDPPEETTEDEVDVRASRRYWEAVNRLVDDLMRSYQRATDYESTAQWHDNYARRIDQLSTRRVDPDLIKYAGWISTAIRTLGTSLRGAAVDVAALEQTIYYNVQTFPVYTGAEMWWGVPHTIYGPYNYGRAYETQVHTNLQEVREQQAAAVQETSPEREQIWQMITEERTATQKAMVDRYGEQFAD